MGGLAASLGRQYDYWWAAILVSGKDPDRTPQSPTTRRASGFRSGGRSGPPEVGVKPSTPGCPRPGGLGAHASSEQYELIYTEAQKPGAGSGAILSTPPSNLLDRPPFSLGSRKDTNQAHAYLLEPARTLGQERKRRGLGWSYPLFSHSRRFSSRRHPQFFVPFMTSLPRGGADLVTA